MLTNAMVIEYLASLLMAPNIGSVSGGWGPMGLESWKPWRSTVGGAKPHDWQSQLILVLFLSACRSILQG